MKPFTTIAALLFTAGLIFHAARLYFGWEVVVDQHVIPVKASFVFVAFAALMVWGLWREAR